MDNPIFKIKSFESTIGQITVVFFDGSELCIDIPIHNNQYLTGDALDTYISGFAPNTEGRIEEVKRVVNSEDISKLVDYTIDIDAKKKLEIYVLSNNFAYRDKMLRLTDWIFLEDSPVSSLCKEEWRVYRKTLREILDENTMKLNFDEIAWPLPPKAPLIFNVNYTPEFLNV